MPLKNEVKTIVTCDNPDCIVHLEWTEDAVKESPDGLPNAAWRIVMVILFDQSKHVFCSKQCASIWLHKHAPVLQSPAERAKAMAETHKAIQETHTDGIIEQQLSEPPVVGETELGGEA